MAYEKKTKKKIFFESVIAHVKATFNNTLVSITTPKGDVLLRETAGKLGFKGARKGTPFAATQVATNLSKELLSMGIKNIEVHMQGLGSGRDSAVRAFQSSGLNVQTLRDVTPIPHNGPKAPKKRRV